MGQFFVRRVVQIGALFGLLAAVHVASSERVTASPDEHIFFVEGDGCTGKDKFSIVVHGWKEGCNRTEWIPDTLSNLIEYRGGCVICMDFSKYAVTEDYFGGLVPHFYRVVDTLTWKLRELEGRGFDPASGHMFGFSFGAQAAIEAGRRFGLGKLGRLDVCEPAGPGFDSDGTFSVLNPRLAARNVQCIHTSAEFGTFRRDCHQNWMMGNCGRSQLAAGPFPKGNHGLCPYFYNSAFRNEFRATAKRPECFSFRAAADWPPTFRMGYLSDVQAGVFGDLFCPTTKAYPFNEIATTNEV
ncbi:hypothetical protein quinque_005919 [Culex quinquefasciatus]